MLQRLRDHEEAVFRGREQDLLAAFRETTTTKRGVEADRAMATRKAICENLIIHVHEGADDNCAWPGQKLAAYRLGITDRTYRTHLGWLVDNGFIFEYRTKRMTDGVQSTCYWVVDVVEERLRLDVWAMSATVRLQGLYQITEAEAATRVKAMIEGARARFVTAHPGHYPTDARVLALLNGEEPVVGTTKREARAGVQAACNAVAGSLTARGVAPEEAAATVEDELARRRSSGVPTSARALREDLDSGALEHLHPDVPELPTVPDADVEDLLVEDPPDWWSEEAV